MYKVFHVIVIDNVLVSDDIVEAQFVCNLSKCKGGCCEDGDAGAPISDQELDEVKNAYEIVKPLMTKEGIKEVEQNGLYRYDREFGWVTPTEKFVAMVSAMLLVLSSAHLKRHTTVDLLLGRNQFPVISIQ